LLPTLSRWLHRRSHRDLDRLVNYLKQNWVEVVVFTLAQIVLGRVATATLDSLVGIPVVRDVGIVLLWALIIGGGLWFLGKRFAGSGVQTHTGTPVKAPEETPMWINLPERLRDVAPELVESHPAELGGITPPGIIDELGNLVYELYRTRFLERPPTEAEEARHDAETVLLYEEQFHDAVAVVHDYLETRGVDLETTVNEVQDIRRMAKRLKAASDFQKWPR
jgi:hypothetical protein